MKYTELHEIIRDGSLQSARVVVPYLDAILQPRHVLDVGCGQGWWLSVWQDLIPGPVLGVDGDYVDRNALEIPEENFVACDLARSMPVSRFKKFESDSGKADLLMSLEVAEHLPAKRADTFVFELCQMSDVILFSAAIPGQGGVGHVNEQWPDYWVERFDRCGFDVSGALRFEFWDDDRVENWYRQNLLIARRRDRALPALDVLFDTPLAPVWPLVHPVLWNHHRSLR